MSYNALIPAIHNLGLPGLAARAETGMYSDFATDLPFPKMQLVEDLRASGEYQSVDVEPLVRRIMDGEFDG